MELKQLPPHYADKKGVVLIVPSGIETTEQKKDHSAESVLIVPSGIETTKFG